MALWCACPESSLRLRGVSFEPSRLQPPDDMPGVATVTHDPPQPLSHGSISLNPPSSSGHLQSIFSEASKLVTHDATARERGPSLRCQQQPGSPCNRSTTFRQWLHSGPQPCQAAPRERENDTCVTKEGSEVWYAVVQAGPWGVSTPPLFHYGSAPPSPGPTA